MKKNLIININLYSNIFQRCQEMAHIILSQFPSFNKDQNLFHYTDTSTRPLILILIFQSMNRDLNRFNLYKLVKIDTFILCQNPKLK